MFERLPLSFEFIIFVFSQLHSLASLHLSTIISAVLDLFDNFIGEGGSHIV